MKIEKVVPNVKNFIKSIRDVGYTFEVAVADIVDNSVSAEATSIKIYAVEQPEPFFALLDNGYGMNEPELTEAMRLASKSMDEKRSDKELGKFGLGLKTASFSQCKKLTVISKKDNSINIKRWDLEFISDSNEWLLITPDIVEYRDNVLFKELEVLSSGTLVIWENIDRYKLTKFSHKIDHLSKHLSMVFHRFLENNFKKIKIVINNNEIKPFNPFNPDHMATLEKRTETIRLKNHKIKVTPYILPHHSKVSKEEWERFATEEGYTKSQGFYLYRADRLLIYGTWWGLHRASDASKLVRIKIDTTNDQDELWGIDIKKSTANPVSELKKDLKRILLESIKDGVKPYSKRAKKIHDKTSIKFWELALEDNNIFFKINREHPVYTALTALLSDEQRTLFNNYLKGLENYLPLETIEYQVHHNPHEIQQNSILSDDDIQDIITHLKRIGMDKEYIDKLLKTELLAGRKVFLDEK